MSKFCISVEGPLVTSIKIGDESIPLNMPTEEFYNKYYSVIKDNVKDDGEIKDLKFLQNIFNNSRDSYLKNLLADFKINSYVDFIPPSIMKKLPNSNAVNNFLKRELNENEKANINQFSLWLSELGMYAVAKTSVDDSDVIRRIINFENYELPVFFEHVKSDTKYMISEFAKMEHKLFTTSLENRPKTLDVAVNYFLAANLLFRDFKNYLLSIGYTEEIADDNQYVTRDKLTGSMVIPTAKEYFKRYTELLGANYKIYGLQNNNASESKIYTPTPSIEESVLSVARAIVNGSLPESFEKALREKPELINDDNFLKALRCL